MGIGIEAVFPFGCASGDPKVRRSLDLAVDASYVGKHMAKVVVDPPGGHKERWEGVGRYWGQINPKAFPRAYKEVLLTQSQFTQILRVLRRARYGTRSKRRHHPAIKALRACGPQAVANPDVCPQFIYEKSLPRVRGLHLFMSE